MPQVILEAMAASVPVIASPIEAHRDVIRHGENGWLAGSREQFMSGLKWLSDENVNLKAGNAARGAIRSSFGTWEDAAERYMEIYEELSKPR
jgi:glycosyltransferase involved in cell wall biosynthesis